MERADRVYYFLETILIVLVVILVLLLLITIPTANFWVTNTTVLNEIRLQGYTEVEKVTDISRRYFYPSLVYTSNTKGVRSTYAVDSNILFEYEIKKNE